MVMSSGLVAKATTSIEAPKRKVWEALVTPKAIKEYMFGADVHSEWREGSEITWKGEMKGKAYKDNGIILKIDRERTLQYSHFSPLSGKPDTAENRHVITIELAGEGSRTDVSLTQDNNSDEKARVESEKNWTAMLEGLKKYVERSA
jgi:uncharacterized protein YndB with AHSA1/START domain